MARRTETQPTWDELVALAHGEGIEHIGVAPASVLDRARAELLRRRDAGLHADMAFTYRNPDRSTDPTRAVVDARSIIVAAKPYVADEPVRPSYLSGRVARYAWIDHYEPLRQSLRRIAKRLRAAGYRSVAFADDNSIVDREVAYLGGLGWFGKNANILIRGGGSFFVLGSIITQASYPPAEPVADGCGSCTRCLDECPTGAIVAPGVIDANRCLAWLIQQGGSFPHEYRVALGDRIYGCDDCQEVCPPAVRLGRRHATTLPVVDPYGDRQPPQVWVDIVEMLRVSDETLLNTYGRWYLTDRNPRWLRRNALLVLGNTVRSTDTDAIGELIRYRDGDDALLAEHARWALNQIADREAVTS